MAAQEQKSGKPWSGQNKIPTISQFVESLDRDKKQRDKQLDSQAEGQASVKNAEVMPHKSQERMKNAKTVTDPVTGGQVMIDDVGKEHMKNATDPKLSVPNQALGKPTTVPVDPSMKNPEYKEKQDITAPPDPVAEGSTSDIPIHGEKTNILFHPTPSVSYEPMFASLEKRAGVLSIGILVGIVVVGRMFGGALKGLLPLGFCVASGVWLWTKEVIRSGREVEWSSEQERGHTATANLLPESVEWMNTFLEVVWGLINPDMFAAVADTLEDVMQASVPGVINNVRVAEIDQGSNPIRILSLRALPDSRMGAMKTALHEENKKTKDAQEAAADEEGGEYYNLEASFAYHVKPANGQNVSSRARNMHMNLVFYLGVKGLVGVPLPIFVELQELVGTVRLRLQLTSKPKFRPALRSHGKDKNLPKELQDKPEFQDEKGTLDTEDADAVAHTPPDPLWPSGICSVIVHQIVNLELDNIKGSNGNRKGREFEPAKPYGEGTDEEAKTLPSSYCAILFNDVLVYRTRSKAVSSKPIFNAGTERFVRDWRSAIITVTVRDSRNREHDPILGVVPLRLSDILSTSSQVTRWYPLDGGVGFGRIRISLLFRSVETRLPPNMLGWDVGTFEFLSDRILATGWTNGQTKLKLRTGGSTGKVSRTQCSKTGEGDGVVWDVSAAGNHQVRLPVKYRYRSPVVFEFHVSGKRAAQAYATIWLQHLVDNEETPIDIPIWTTKNGSRLVQNYITERNWSAKETPGLEDLKEIGRLQFRARFKAGTDESHRDFVIDNDTRETFETWEACQAEGVRQRVVEAEVPASIQTAHENSLRQGRDILQQADDKEKKRWLAKDGTDWSGAFGDDPRAYTNRRHSKIAEPGVDDPPHDPVNPSSDDDDEDLESGSSSDLGITDATNAPEGGFRKRSGSQSAANGDASSPPQSDARGSIETGTTGDTTMTDTGSVTSPRSKDAKWDAGVDKRTEKRKQRGMMQWKPARNAQFAKDQAKIGMSRIKKRLTGGLGGREPGVETET